MYYSELFGNSPNRLIKRDFTDKKENICVADIFIGYPVMYELNVASSALRIGESAGKEKFRLLSNYMIMNTSI